MWPPQRRIGQLLGGKYRVQAVLALGGMGVVYAGRHELTGRSVAIKLLRPELATQPDLLRRVAAEARLAVEASHPNVVEVLDAGADELGIPYLVLERLYGKPLEALLGERLSLVTAARALVPVMNALTALHGAGIVHRDIKPSNIFLSCEGGRVIPKLLDFGIAKALAASDTTQSNVALGTPSYMAPEQALGCATLGPATDVWSMGVVLVRCLTGRLPFEALPTRGPSALRSGLLPEQLQHVPESVGEVLVGALKLEPDDRFPNMAAFQNALLDALKRWDPLESWPGEATASYAMSEFTADGVLESQLASTFPSEGSDADHRPARPADVLTRTLSRLVPASPGARWKRVAAGAFSVLAVSGALAVAARRQPEPSLSAVPEPPSSRPLGTPGREALVATPVAGDAEGSRTFSRPALDRDAPSAGLSPVVASPAALAARAEFAPSALGAPVPSRRKSRRQTSAEPLDPNAHEALPGPTQPVEPALGPNRAPIIE